jgi:hypothetical protein
MIVRDWLRRKEIENFATDLARDLGRRFPPASEKRTDKGAANQLAAITAGLHERSAGFCRGKGLGVYGRAKLGNTFRWQLHELGYSEKFVDSVTHELVLGMSRGR